MIRKEEHDRRRRAYEATANDREAAALLDMPIGTFYRWRVRFGVKAKARRGGQQRRATPTMNGVERASA